MSPVSLLLNILWIALGGLWMAAGWVIAVIIMVITIIGLPWVGWRSISPSTRYFRCAEAVSREYVTGQEDVGTGVLACLGQYHLVVLAGWRWLLIPASRR